MNLDLRPFGYLSGALSSCADTGKVVLGISTYLNSTEQEQVYIGGFYDLILQSGQYRHDKERFENDAFSNMVYPVFDRFGEDRKVTGVLATRFYWRFMLTDILPQGTQGIICVVESTDGQKHTFEVVGPRAKYLGPGDFHDPQYNDMEFDIDLVTEIREAAHPDTRSFTTAEVSGQFLNYTLRVYPSKEYERFFVTERVIAGVFVVAISLFLLYDYCVQRRQRIVLDRAVRATAVVSSLYPAGIRERIINEQQSGKPSEAKRKDAFLASAVQESGKDASPLATKYSDCTVYFADLAGFTRWSSTRQPEHVFQLLESLFKEFDKLAERRGVFKVETIGDCYMAVVSTISKETNERVYLMFLAHSVAVSHYYLGDCCTCFL